MKEFQMATNWERHACLPGAVWRMGEINLRRSNHTLSACVKDIVEKGGACLGPALPLT
jgi:hypothetical protein